MGIITDIIKRNGYLDNIYVHRHLRDVLDFQDKLRKCFSNLPKGIWEAMRCGDYIDLICLDRDNGPLRFK